MNGPYLVPDGRAGSPVAPINPDHQPRVPLAGGVPPFCSCGYVGGRKPGTLLADHIKATGGWK